MGELIRNKLIVESRLDAITEVRHWAVQQARHAGFDAEAIFAINLAVGEALANVVQHAYDGQAGHQIHLSLIIDETKFSLTIRDFGQKFDLDSYTPPNLDVPGEGGYGVYLIKQVMDEVTYNTSRPQGTQLNIVKYRSGVSRA